VEKNTKNKDKRKKPAFIFIRYSPSQISVRLESRVYISWSAAFRSVAGDILELAFFLAAWTDIRPDRGCDKKSAVTAFPVSQATSRADISAEVPG
jgi:hypothetical protein